MSEQKTTLTLIGRPFLFAGDIQLVRGKAQEVDISALSPSQLKTLKKYIDAGQLTSTQELTCTETAFACTLGAPSEEPVQGGSSGGGQGGTGVPGPRPEAEEESEDAVDEEDGLEAEEESEDPTEKELREKYNKMSVEDLKKEVKKLSVDTQATTKRGLIKALIAHAKESATVEPEE